LNQSFSGQTGSFTVTRQSPTNSFVLSIDDLAQAIVPSLAGRSSPSYFSLLMLQPSPFKGSTPGLISSSITFDDPVSERPMVFSNPGDRISLRLLYDANSCLDNCIPECRIWVNREWTTDTMVTELISNTDGKSIIKCHFGMFGTVAVFHSVIGGKNMSSTGTLSSDSSSMSFVPSPDAESSSILPYIYYVVPAFVLLVCLGIICYYRRRTKKPKKIGALQPRAQIEKEKTVIHMTVIPSPSSPKQNTPRRNSV